jgi:hypothetical protein
LEKSFLVAPAESFFGKTKEFALSEPKYAAVKKLLPRYLEEYVEDAENVSTGLIANLFGSMRCGSMIYHSEFSRCDFLRGLFSHGRNRCTSVYVNCNNGQEVADVVYFFKWRVGREDHLLAFCKIREMSKLTFQSASNKVRLVGGYIGESTNMIVPVSCIAKKVALVPYTTSLHNQSFKFVAGLYLPIELDLPFDFDFD